MQLRRTLAYVSFFCLFYFQQHTNLILIPSIPSNHTTFSPPLYHLIMSPSDTLSYPLYYLINSSQHLMGSKHLMDRDLEPLHSSPLRHTLTNIDFTGCVKLTDRGVGVLANALGRGLASLSVAKTKVTDHGEYPHPRQIIPMQSFHSLIL